MNFFRFIFTKTFWIQVVIAAVVTVVLCFTYLFWLDWYTNHDQKIEVPNLEKLSLTEVDEQLEVLDLRRKIIDSASYNPAFKPRTVIEQDPLAGKFVKENRQIYIKLNASGYGKVTVPNLIYKTRRQAIPTLEALGFKIGQITYKPNIAENTVLEMRYKGATLEPGSQLSKTSTIDLVLADGNNPSAIEQPTNNE
ncbi:serine/threonine protein kinase [Nonlabens sp. MB-3u-79]|jgi:beta-lactam-binding protein with PASTA domain|uniref:PASTA domain-containing protein n=1 Tax=Nonlabens sp. MB-3u-79 TaxID=2058134 RepID=UPI000C308B19|nr:PASTA domain-containing protein [Nonlabens sp. MB-3u-79]AUC79188.1 serine/threonine protein kinase [Nonlabens sp. MB-3u-79]|tara:strand:+ start:60723 stop:61307 length:585 start_codon:yes stop_codon:yes gene_type:complete